MAVAADDDGGDDWGVEQALMIPLKAMAMASDGYGSCPGVGIVFVYAVVVVVVVVFRMRNWSRGGGAGHWNGQWSHTNKVVKAASSCLNGVRSPCPVNLSVLSCLVLSRLVLSCLVYQACQTCQTLVKPTKPATEPVTVHSPSHRRQHLGWALGYFRALAFPTNDIATNYTLHFCIPRWLLSYFGAHGPCMINIFLPLFFFLSRIYTYTYTYTHTH